VLSTQYRRNTDVIRQDYADNIHTEAALRMGTWCVMNPRIQVPQEGEGRGGQEIHSFHSYGEQL